MNNREKQKIWASEHYLRNKEKMIAKAKINNKLARERNRKYISNYLSIHSCVDCGNSNPIVLEFDHVRGQKLQDISNMSYRAYSIKAIQNEIDKCDVRCANCHRIVTHKRRVDEDRIELST